MSRGFVPHEGAFPAPDMSFVRLFADAPAGWQLRGQYAVWIGASSAGRPDYLLLERIGQRVAPIAYSDGRPLFHEIKAGIAFNVQGMSGYWLTFDSDALWLDTPGPDGRFAVLTVGGAAGKPRDVTMDWTCVRCGSSVSPRAFRIEHAFTRFLADAEVYAKEVGADPALRTCASCGAIHPPVPGLIEQTPSTSAAASEAAHAQ